VQKVISLIYGDDIHIQHPRGMSSGHGEYEFNILMKQYKFFGPFPPKYDELLQGNRNIDTIIEYLFNSIPKSEMTPFSQISEREVSKRDKQFICRIMKMDPRDRPTASELLQDDWFEEEPVVEKEADQLAIPQADRSA
jgi:serine/threonine protein kinase